MGILLVTYPSISLQFPSKCQIYFGRGMAYLVYCTIKQQQQHDVYTPKTAEPSNILLENITRFTCLLEVWCILMHLVHFALMHWCILDLVYKYNKSGGHNQINFPNLFLSFLDNKCFVLQLLCSHNELL